MSRRSHRLARRSPSRRPSLEALEARELLTGFTVINTADSGPGSLRAAILAVNADNVVGADSISFNIASGGVQTIALKTALPAVTRSVAIDAASEPGYSATNPSPLVVIDGSAVAPGADGLTLAAGGGGFIRGLSIVGFTSGPQGGGSGIILEGSAGDNVIEANYLGVRPDGSTPGPNANGIVVFTPGNKIGSTTQGSGNLISGNANAGVLIVGAPATSNLVTGNRIGTDQTGFFGVGNTFGVILAAPNNRVGGTSAAEGNLISGNVGPNGQSGAGVLFEGDSTGNVVDGNLIGTDVSGGTASGAGAVPNVYGVYFGTPGGSATDTIAQDTIGGTAQGAGNVISGNFIGITGNVTASLIAGNTIGLASNGLKPVPNGDGILLGASATTIGGTTASARNLIAASNTANGAVGTGLDLTGDSDLVQGNTIGLTAAGKVGPGIANVTGIALHATNSTIGGTAQGAGNVIANNSGDGLTLDNNGGNLIAGNAIGFTSGGVTVNGGNGISITLTPPPGGGAAPPLTLNDTIGGTAAGAGNTISGSFAGSGVVVHSTYPAAVTGLSIRGNAIYANGRIGIDLAGDNTPIPGKLFITSATPAASGGGVTLTGTFSGAPSTTYGIDLFGNAADAPVSPTGYGPGQYYLGSVNVTTDGSGFASFSPTLSTPQAALVAYSGTATGPNGNTSEFSANFQPSTAPPPSADLAVTAASSASSVVVGGLVTLTETVTNNGPADAAGVVLTDSLPVSLINAKVTTTAGTASIGANNVLTASIGAIGSGGLVTITITGNASQLGPLVDSPGVSGTTLDPNFANNTATQTVTVTTVAGGPNADLAITSSTSSAPVTFGSNVTYTLTVTNNGPADATNVTLNDFLPGGVALAGAQQSQGATPLVNGTLVVEKFGTIASGASATLTIVVTPAGTGTYQDSANVSGNQFDPVTANNSTAATATVISPVTPPPPVTPSINLLLSSAVFPTVGTVGSVQLFTFTVTNFGPDPATNVTIIDLIPTNAVFLLAGPSQGGPASLANRVITSDVGTLAAGASATLTVALVPTSPGGFFNFGGAFTPDVPTATPSFAYGAVPVLAPAPPPAAIAGPGVIGLAGTGNLSQLVVLFNEPLNPFAATNRTNYVLTSTRGNQRIPVVLASYNQAGNSVMLVASSPLVANRNYRLVVVGTAPSGIVDVQGRRLVGRPGGPAGTTYTTTFVAGNLPQV